MCSRPSSSTWLPGWAGASASVNERARLGRARPAPISCPDYNGMRSAPSGSRKPFGRSVAQRPVMTAAPATGESVGWRAPAIRLKIRNSCELLQEKAFSRRSAKGRSTGLHGRRSERKIERRSAIAPHHDDCRTLLPRLLAILKHFRRFSTRFDRRALHFIALIHLAAAMRSMRGCRFSLASMMTPTIPRRASGANQGRLGL
jgi:hypothetical protein